MDGDVKLLQAN